MKPVAGVLPIVAAVALAGCGGSSSSASATANGGPRPFAALTSAQRACLKKQGVTPPTGRGRQPSGGQPPTGTAPSGPPPGGAQRFLKMRAAMQACGITIPQRGPGAPTTGSQS
jgi:hypothetical protein